MSENMEMNAKSEPIAAGMNGRDNDGKVPLPELQERWRRCRALLRSVAPEAEGMIVFSRLGIYYFTGTFGTGIFWLPLEGEPVLLCRRGLERARIESPLSAMAPYRSYRDIEGVLRESGSPLSRRVAVEMNGLSWSLGSLFARHFAGYELLPGDAVLAMVRATKSAWELERLTAAGKRHGRCLSELLPPLLAEKQSELAIGHTLFALMLEQGHHGILRMANHGEEVFLGHIAAGDSGNYPSVFNGPVGLRGVHPATPHLGSPARKWRIGEALTIDVGFSFEGYQTDKTQVYWLGKEIPDQVRAAQDFCMDLQQWVAEQLRPGVIPARIWDECRQRAEKSGWADGFMGLPANRVSFVGHGIGLAVDEYPVLAAGFDLPLEENMVLAVEPKIGLPGIGMVGVENTFVVTPVGGRCLTGDFSPLITIGRSRESR